MEGKDWRKWLDSFMLDYRTSVHQGIKKTPASVLLKYEVRNNVPGLVKSQRSMAHCELVENDTKYKGILKTYADNKRKAKQVDVEVGDKVLLMDMRKFKDSIFENEIYEVMKVYERSVKLQSSDGKIIIRNKAHIKVFERNSSKNNQSETMKIFEKESSKNSQSENVENRRKHY